MSTSVWLLLAAAGAYGGAALTRLLSLSSIAMLLRTLGLMSFAAWLGYGVSLALMATILAIVATASVLPARPLALAALFALLAGGIVWIAPQPLNPLLLIGLIAADQLAGALLARVPPRLVLPNWLLAAALIAVLVAAAIGGRWLLGMSQPPATARTLGQLPGALLDGELRIWMQLEQTPQGALWVDRRASSAGRCALLFHGAHRDGTLQTTTRSLLRSLRLADYRTIAIDHPGYGQSPAPTTDALIAWDPAGLTDAALQRSEAAGCSSLLLIGHSMGVTEALRLSYELPSNPRVVRVLLLGGGLFEADGSTDAYWHDRFHIDRRLSRRIPQERWREIRDAYYRNEAYCEAGMRRAAKTDLDFLTFAHEHENLMASRETLWRCLAFATARRRELPTSHYLDTLSLGPLSLLQFDAIDAFHSHLQTIRPSGS